jgi:hypothetical protein
VKNFLSQQAAVALCGGMIMCGCDISHMSRPGYKETVRDGIHTIPHVQEIVKMFPGATIDNFITNYNLTQQTPHTWNTEVFFGGRYILTYQVDVIIDYRKHRIEKIVSPVKFNLRSLASVDRGDGEFTRCEWDRHFGEPEWNKVVAANGDFSVIGIHLDLKSPPIPGWDDYVRGWSEPRIHVEP